MLNWEVDCILPSDLLGLLLQRLAGKVRREWSEKCGRGSGIWIIRDLVLRGVQAESALRLRYSICVGGLEARYRVLCHAYVRILYIEYANFVLCHHTAVHRVSVSQSRYHHDGSMPTLPGLNRVSNQASQLAKA